MTKTTDNTQQLHTERRHVVIFGYQKKEIDRIMGHFKLHLPENVKMQIQTEALATHITLTGTSAGVELLRFNMNKLQHTICELFPEELICQQNKTIAEVLGAKLQENDLTVSTAESCTGGNIAHRIVQVSGSSAYFLGSVVSYSNDVKAEVLGVKRRDLDQHGAVSRQVVEQMAKGVCELMRTDCAIATSGIAGPDGGTRYKPVGTVWIAVKCQDQIVSECKHFDGTRNEVMESATNHGMVMLINMLRKNYIMQEEFNDE